jgi:hypothetical protein
MENLNARMTVAMLSGFILLATIPAASCSNLGIKSGDWIEYDIQESFSPANRQRIEFLSVAGTAVTMHETVHMSQAVDVDQTETIDLASADDFPMSFLSARAHVIPVDVSVGDQVYLGKEIGNRTISGETTKGYAGADRRIIYSNFSMLESQYVFYWDKQTGVLVEATMSSSAMYKTLVAAETNMWSGGLSWWLWAIIVIVIACGVLSSKKVVTNRLHRMIDARHAGQKPR